MKRLAATQPGINREARPRGANAEIKHKHRKDWLGLVRYGVCFFVLEKFAAVIGVSNIHVYAAFRGQSLEDFQKTRNAQVLYSVGGKETLEKADADAAE